jgi:hypothetical protein
VHGSRQGISFIEPLSSHPKRELSPHSFLNHYEPNEIHQTMEKKRRASVEVEEIVNKPKRQRRASRLLNLNKSSAAIKAM